MQAGRKVVGGQPPAHSANRNDSSWPKVGELHVCLSVNSGPVVLARSFSTPDPKQTYVPCGLEPLGSAIWGQSLLHDLAEPMKCSTTGISATVSSVTLSPRL